MRSTVTALLVAAPALAAALGLTALETYRVAAPEAVVFGGPRASSLADAIANGRGVESAYVFIRAGQDPNAPVVVTNPNYAEGGPITVSPLMLAVAARDANVALMLLNFGARFDRPQNARALCLARHTGNAEMIAMLESYGAPQACGAPRAGRTSLGDWVD